MSHVFNDIECLDAVKTLCSGQSDRYVRFLNLMLSWFDNQPGASIDELIGTISAILKTKPTLLHDFNAFLASSNYRIELVTPLQEVELLIVITPSGARIQAVSEPCPTPPVPHVTNTDELRELILQGRGIENLTSLKSVWASCTLQLLQAELDKQHVDESYRQKCLQCVRRLIKNSGVLPPSFYVRNVVREGDVPISGGGFADIYNGSWNGETVCLKVVRVFSAEDLLTDKSLKLFRNEAFVWRQLHHPNILPFYGINEELFVHRLCLISPWMAKGDVMNFLRAHPDHDRISLLTQITYGISYLHYLKIIHGDIKGANILIADDLRPRLGDFGLAHMMESQNVNTATSSLAKGTVRWMAPELMVPSAQSPSISNVKTAVDIYAFGCTMLEILTGSPPFSDHKQDAAVISAVAQGVRPQRPSLDLEFSDEIWSLINLQKMCPVLPIPNSTSHTDIRRFDIDIPRVKEWLLREIHGRKQTPDTSRVEVAPSSTSHGQQHGISRELNNPPHPSQSLTAPGSSSPPILNVSAIPDGGAHVLPQEKEIRKSLSDKRAIARAKVTSDAIDIQIRRDRGMLRSSRKILLLGTSKSGKSTVLKQMKIMYQGVFSREELMSYRPAIYYHVLSSAQAIIKAMLRIGIDFQRPENKGTAKTVMDYRIEYTSTFAFSSSVANAIDSLWRDPIMTTVMSYSSTMDNAAYFLEETLRIAQTDYLPTTRDILNVRIASTRVVETQFEINKLPISVIDMGGLQSEWRKWIPFFEGIPTVLFCVALSDYDQVLLEDQDQNQLLESLELFDALVNSRWFPRTSFILLFNKMDVFKQKLSKSPLETYFPEYSGGDNVDQAKKFILDRFVQVAQSRRKAHNLYAQGATDTSNSAIVIPCVLQDIRRGVIRRELENLGLTRQRSARPSISPSNRLHAKSHSRISYTL